MYFIGASQSVAPIRSWLFSAACVLRSPSRGESV